MASTYARLTNMLETVARALGEDLLPEVAFVGGCTTGLLITDDFTKEEVRYTEDVDLIVSILGYAHWSAFQQQLQKKGFSISMQDDVICRMRLGELKVDFMPDDEGVLGFSNRWYADALRTAQDYPLKDDLIIRVVSSPYFLATKLEAYLGRGNNDPLISHDIEDILNLVDGRPELIHEIQSGDPELITYIAKQIQSLLAHRDIDYVVQGVVRGDAGRAALIFKRLEVLAGSGKPRTD